MVTAQSGTGCKAESVCEAHYNIYIYITSQLRVLEILSWFLKDDIFASLNVFLFVRAKVEETIPLMPCTMLYLRLYDIEHREKELGRVDSPFESLASSITNALLLVTLIEMCKMRQFN